MAQSAACGWRPLFLVIRLIILPLVHATGSTISVQSATSYPARVFSNSVLVPTRRRRRSRRPIRRSSQARSSSATRNITLINASCRDDKCSIVQDGVYHLEHLNVCGCALILCVTVSVTGIISEISRRSCKAAFLASFGETKLLSLPSEQQTKAPMYYVPSKTDTLNEKVRWWADVDCIVLFTRPTTPWPRLRLVLVEGLPHLVGCCEEIFLGSFLRMSCFSFSFISWVHNWQSSIQCLFLALLHTKKGNNWIGRWGLPCL